ncbi:hypothetical protein HF078_15310 [Bacillus sp. RO2]|jgi:hypothetical protein|uniref:hypothetical protein n=1 Tax=Bacillus sp. RO2 TaxID=2723913 RepID=UPI00145C6B6B|nr:hypothetical protein [Bacillus sp. RO2]NMH74456.1 hypothetical protein [Bacillus sp. RO2]
MLRAITKENAEKLKIYVVKEFIAVDWSKRRRLLREIALGGDPTGVAEEAPAAPLGKRSHLRKSTAALKRSNDVKRLKVAPKKANPGTEGDRELTRTVEFCRIMISQGIIISIGSVRLPYSIMKLILKHGGDINVICVRCR